MCNAFIKLIMARSEEEAGLRCYDSCFTQAEKTMLEKSKAVDTKYIQNKESQDSFNQLLQELRVLDVSSYRNFVRTDAATFEELLRMVAPLITYQDITMREAILLAERLAVTLRFLATGELYSFSVSMQYQSCMMMMTMMMMTILHYR